MVPAETNVNWNVAEVTTRPCLRTNVKSHIALLLMVLSLCLRLQPVCA